MTLIEWLGENKLSRVAFAEMLAKDGMHVSVHAIGKWARGERLPRRAALQKITKITKNEVTAADFIRA